jgi:hypothetical protein
MEPFLLKPANRNILLGNPSKSVLYVRTVLWSLVLVECLILVCAASAAREWITGYRLEWYGDRASARVTALRCDTVEFTHYFVTYEIDVDDKTVEGSAREEEVRGSYYAKLKVGETVPVLLFPESPAVSRLAEDDAWRSKRSSVFFGSLLVGLPLLGAVGWQVRKLRLVRDGRILEGKLIFCSGEMDSDHDCRIRATFAFVSPQGRILSGRASVYRNDLKDAPLPGPDTTVAVLYLDDHNYQVL